MDNTRASQPDLDGHSVPVVVIGGGQAGLSMSWHLKQHGVEHVVLERDAVGSEWRNRRWDSFCLVTPNWQCQLPGWPYRGEDPDGFLVKDEIVRYLEGYAASFAPPLHEGVEVTRLATSSPESGSGYVVETSAGTVHAEAVVIAAGPYHAPKVPRLAERLPPDVVQLHSSAYRRPDQLPDGEVLVVGSGQSGVQIAEDLHLAGRTVHLATGSTPRVARFYRGRDVVAWLHDMGYYDLPVFEHPLGEGARRQTNHYVTGRDGGHDLDLRAFAREGMQLHGRLLSLDGSTLHFGSDLEHNLDHADEVFNGINASIDKHIATSGLEAPPGAAYEPVWRPGADAPRELDVSTLSSVVWALGYDRRYPWVDVPVFDGRGYPTHTRGVTSVPGLYVLGLPWLYTWGSGRFSGVARDSEYLLGQVLEQLGTRVARAA